MKKWIIKVCIIVFVIPSNNSFAQAASQESRNIYQVKSGDTLKKIAAKYDTTIEELKRTNGLQSHSLFVGQRLRVPILYEVVAGDTLQSIAQAHHSTVETIKTTNGLSSDALFVGQIIKIAPKRMAMQGQHIVMTREEFKDWLLNHKFSRKVKLIQQHHTWKPAYQHFDGSNYFSLLNGMELYHKREKKWSNIAQHITTFPDGKLAISRPFNIAPEGTIGYKANSLGLTIENIGNFDKGFDVMTKEQKETIVYITALLCIKFGLTPTIDTITYHHWWDLTTGERVLDNSADHAVKTCPGTNFFGGNSTTSAQTYFYPLVTQKMNEILSTMK